jgi:FkbH-like protein
MFGYDFSTKQGKIDFSLNYDNSYIKNITHIAPLMWGEHCVECGVPDCYKSCSLYSRRSDGQCKRFSNGIERIDRYDGLYSNIIKIDFMKWSKLGCVLLPNCLSKNNILIQDKIFLFITTCVKIVSTLIPIGFFKKMSYYYKEFISRLEGKGCNFPEMLLIEISNSGDAYSLYIENQVNGKMCYRNRIDIKKGFNRFCIPFCDLNYASDLRNFISIIPQNERQTVYFHTLDLVKINMNNISGQNKIKCVVWDLDNTLWDGILSEGDTLKINHAVIECIQSLDKKGVLNSIASKNDYEEAFKKLQEFGISEYFLYPQINWGPKSEGIKKIAESLNIGLDTFMFIDDSEFELREVSNKLPMVRCFNASNIKNAMEIDALQFNISEESKKRRLSYMEIEKRNNAEQTYNGDIDDFLRSCNMILTIACPTETTLLRCSELINRTNQLNISGQRIAFQDLKNIVNMKEKYLSLQMNCMDNFGDYGIIGFCIINIQNKEEAVLEHFVLSCRAARKKIEESFIIFLIRYFRQIGFGCFVINYTKTSKNGILFSTISDLGFFSKKNINDRQFIFDVKTAKEIDNIDIITIKSNIH